MSKSVISEFKRRSSAWNKTVTGLLFLTLTACTGGGGTLLSQNQNDNNISIAGSSGFSADTSVAQTTQAQSSSATSVATQVATQQIANQSPGPFGTSAANSAQQTVSTAINTQTSNTVVAAAETAAVATETVANTAANAEEQLESAEEEAETTKRRLLPNTGLQRRWNKLTGRAGSLGTRRASSRVDEDEIVGQWRLEEEDGLRQCAITLGSEDDNYLVQLSAGCSGSVTPTVSWGFFGNDLLLRDSQKAVIARLKKSATSWAGFTLDTGIPIVIRR